MKKSVNIKKIFKSILKTLLVITTIIVIALFGIGLYKAIAKYVFGNSMPKIFGYSSAIVVSGSMAPEILVDDLIIIKFQKENYEIGDIITFESGQSFVTHRIVGVNEEGYVTKGDANNVADTSPVIKEKIIGRVTYNISGIGKFTTWLQSPLGMIIALLVVLLMVFSDRIVSKIKNIKNKKEISGLK